MLAGRVFNGLVQELRAARRFVAPLGAIARDTSGVASIEYVILVGTVGLGSAIAFISVGVAFVRNFALVRTLLLTPFP